MNPVKLAWTMVEMIPESILFYWSKGSETRRKMVRRVFEEEAKGRPVFLNSLAKDLGISHVAARKHVELLIEEGYLEKINPGGRPVYLRLSKKGERVAKELSGMK